MELSSATPAADQAKAWECRQLQRREERENEAAFGDFNVSVCTAINTVCFLCSHLYMVASPYFDCGHVKHLDCVCLQSVSFDKSISRRSPVH